MLEPSPATHCAAGQDDMPCSRRREPSPAMLDAGSSIPRCTVRTSSSSSPTTSASPTWAATAAAAFRCRRCSTGWPRKALRFTQGYANSPVCSPTRFALMTARYQYRLRGAAEEPINSRSRGSTTLGLPPEHPTLPSLLQRRRLPHRADRQVAPGLSAGLRAAALGLRRVLRADVGRRRLLHPLRIRAARTTCGSARKRTARRATSPT